MNILKTTTISLITLSLLLSGCTLPPRTGCLAGDIRYSFVSKTPQNIVATANCWSKDEPCSGYKATVRHSDGITTASCEPND